MMFAEIFKSKIDFQISCRSNLVDRLLDYGFFNCFSAYCFTFPKCILRGMILYLQKSYHYKVSWTYLKESSSIYKQFHNQVEWKISQVHLEAREFNSLGAAFRRYLGTTQCTKGLLIMFKIECSYIFIAYSLKLQFFWITTSSFCIEL